jgi:hypothetical protein
MQTENPRGNQPDIVTIGGIVLWSLDLIGKELAVSADDVRTLLEDLQAKLPSAQTWPTPILSWGGKSYVNVHALIRLFHLASDPTTPYTDLPLIEAEFRRARREALVSVLRRMFPDKPLSPPKKVGPPHRGQYARVGTIALPAVLPLRTRPRKPRPK